MVERHKEGNHYLFQNWSGLLYPPHPNILVHFLEEQVGNTKSLNSCVQVLRTEFLVCLLASTEKGPDIVYFFLELEFHSILSSWIVPTCNALPGQENVPLFLMA